jgi:hypothetical protein
MNGTEGLFRKFMNKFLVFFSGKPAGDIKIEGMLSQSAFDRELLRQRSCTSRTGFGFMVLSFDIDRDGLGRGSLDAMLTLLASCVCGKSRISDVSGWYGKNRTRPSLILLSATSPGALRVIAAVEEEFRARAAQLFSDSVTVPELQCDIFSYPSELGEGAPEWVVAEMPAPAGK